MIANIRKIGNSLGVFLNKEIIKSANLKVNDKVNISIEDNKIIIKKEQPNNIYELFNGYVDDNTREPLLLDEDSVGNEVW